MTAASAQRLPLDVFSECVQLCAENKVSVKNAFDLELIDRLDNIIFSCVGDGTSAGNAGAITLPLAGHEAKSEELGCSFHAASCALQASARIYECRVDRVHSCAFGILDGLSVPDLSDDDDGESRGKAEPVAAKRRRIYGVNTLERNEANIVRQHVEIDEYADPMFRRMSATFDGGGRGANGLLLNRLPIGEDLSLVLYSDKPIAQAATAARTIFSTPSKLRVSELGLGDPSAFCKQFSGLRLCPEIGAFRRELYGDVPMDVTLPMSLKTPPSNACPPGASRVTSSQIVTVAASKRANQTTLGRWARVRPKRRLYDKTKVGIAKKTVMGKVAQSSGAAPAAPLPRPMAASGSPPSEMAAGEAVTFDELLEHFRDEHRGTHHFVQTLTETPSKSGTSNSPPDTAPEVVTTPSRLKPTSRKPAPSASWLTPKLARSKPPIGPSSQRTLLPFCKKHADDVQPICDGEISYSRNSKFVDVTSVKRALRECIRDDVAATKGGGEQDADSGGRSVDCSFQGLMDRLLQKMSRTEAENVSVAVCFGSLLHVCGENDLELKPGDGPGDLDVVGLL